MAQDCFDSEVQLRIRNAIYRASTGHGSSYRINETVKVIVASVPTTATLSLLALAGLAARRRRK